jgi:hypothetical protein
LRRYFQNSDIHMSKDAYFEMCEMLGQEPIDEEIPVEIGDFPDLVQQCFVVYQILPDSWDSMGGGYMGKDYTIVFNLLQVYGVTDPEEILLVLDFLQHMDGVRQKLIAEKIKAKSPQH